MTLGAAAVAGADRMLIELPGMDVLAAALAGVMLVCCFAVGSLVLDRFAREVKPGERLLYATLLGCGIAAALILVLGAVGLLQPVPLWGVVLLCGAAGHRHLARLPSCLRELFAPLAAWSWLSRRLAQLLLLSVFLVMLLGAFPPATDWDSLMYHVAIPRAFLGQGSVFVPADNLHVAYVGLWHMLYLPLLAVGASSGPALLNVFAAMLLGGAVLYTGDRYFGRTTAVLAFVILWGFSAIVLVAATPRIDVAVTLCLFVVHLALMGAIDERRGDLLVVAAALASVAGGMKYHALMYLAVLVPLGVWAALRAKTTTSAALRAIVLCVTVTVVGMTPWLLKNQVLLDGPLYPFLTERRFPPWLADIAGSSVIAPDVVARGMFEVLGQAREPISLRALVFDPASLTVEAEGRDFTMSPLLLLLPLALLFTNRAMLLLLAPAVGYLLVLFATSRFINLRYLLLAVPSLTLVLSETMRRGVERLARGRSLRTPLLVAAFVTLIPAARSVQHQLITAHHIAGSTGLISDQAYLAASQIPGFHSYLLTTQWLDRHTTPDDRVLLLFEARGLYFRRDVIQDNDLTNWPLLVATGAPEECLRGTSITHVLVNSAVGGYYQHRGSDMAALDWDDFQEFADRCLEPVHAEGYYRLFRVRAEGAAQVDTP